MHIRKHRKKLVVLISLIMILSFLIIIFYFSKIFSQDSIENAPLWEYEGVIVHHVEEWGDFWDWR